jgi:hypothetical protein
MLVRAPSWLYSSSGRLPIATARSFVSFSWWTFLYGFCLGINELTRLRSLLYVYYCRQHRLSRGEIAFLFPEL